MANSKKLKQKLRASDRRRRRRAESSETTTALSESPVKAPTKTSVDVIGLVVDAILKHASKSPDPAIDLVVSAALRSSQKGTIPSGEQSSQLALAFTGIRDREEVSDRAFQAALKQLSQMQSEQQESKNKDSKIAVSKKTGNQFVQYLKLLAS